MCVITEAIRLPRTAARHSSRFGAVLTLARRRAMLTASNPRQIAVPLLGPALLALILAPALKKATGGLHSHIDYTSYVGVGAVGLVIPLSSVFAGLSVIVDRHAGALFPISAMPGALTDIAKVMPLTHALALLRYGLIDPSGRGLHDIWGMHNATTEAWLSLAVVAVYAVALTAIAIRVFERAAV